MGDGAVDARGAVRIACVAVRQEPAMMMLVGGRRGKTMIPLALLLLLVVLASCAAEPPAPIQLSPEVVRSSERFTREYVVQPGDQLQVTIFHAPELTSSVTVRPDGYVSLPLVKDVRLAGLSVPDADQELQKLYAARLNNPDVTVSVLNPPQASVYVFGDVPHPGPVPAREAPTLAVALAAAGGTLRTASMDNVAVIRLEDDGVLAGYIISRKNNGETAFYMAMAATPLKTNDIVVVPESGRSQFVRFIQDFINTPLTGVNQIISPIFEYQTIRLVARPS
jgi:polysaccharide export outer membrane protein